MGLAEISIGLQIYAQRILTLAAPAIYMVQRAANIIGSSQMLNWVQRAATGTFSGLYKLSGQQYYMMRLQAGVGFEKILNPIMRLVGAVKPDFYIRLANGLKAKPDWLIGSNIFDAKLGQALSSTSQQFQVYINWAAQNGGSVTYITLTRVNPAVADQMVAAGQRLGVNVTILSILF